MEVFQRETACVKCGATGSTFSFHSADSGECALPERTTEHVHRSCDSCGHEWAEPMPHLRKRDYPKWALEADQ
jgi:hypothetical protein